MKIKWKCNGFLSPLFLSSLYNLCSARAQQGAASNHLIFVSILEACALDLK